MTIEDRIKTMNRDELARFIASLMNYDFCELCTKNVVTTDDSNYIHKYLSLTKERRYVINKIIDTLVQIEEKERNTTK